MRLVSAASRVAIAFGAIVITVPAWGHSGTGLAGGFPSGFKHPFTGADHLLAMVAVGLWGAFLGRPLVYVLPIVFPMVMVMGGIMGMMDLPLPSTEIGIALSVITLGACILCAARPPVVVAAAMVGLFAIFHGFAHGRELPSAADPVGYSLGFVLATGLLHVTGILLGLIKERPHGELVIRVTGAAIAVAGVGFLPVTGIQ